MNHLIELLSPRIFLPSFLLPLSHFLSLSFIPSHFHSLPLSPISLSLSLSLSVFLLIFFRSPSLSCSLDLIPSLFLSPTHHSYPRLDGSYLWLDLSSQRRIQPSLFLSSFSWPSHLSSLVHFNADSFPPSLPQFLFLSLPRFLSFFLSSFHLPRTLILDRKHSQIRIVDSSRTHHRRETRTQEWKRHLVWTFTSFFSILSLSILFFFSLFNHPLSFPWSGSFPS